MSTRGMIGKLNADGTITAIYSHSNNYAEANGWLLSTHYADSVLVDQLLALEAICEVGLVIGEKHPYRDQARVTPGGWLKQCLSFYRDRGEELVMSCTLTMAEWPSMADSYDSEMVFLWNGISWCCAAVRGVGDYAHFGPWYRLISDGDTCHTEIINERYAAAA